MKRATEDEEGDSDAVLSSSAVAETHCHLHDAASVRASTAAVREHAPASASAVIPALLPDSDEKIQKAVARELATYGTKNPVVTDAVLTFHYNVRSSPTGDANAGPAAVTTLFESSIVNGDVEMVRRLLESGVRVDAAIGEDPELLFGPVELLPVHVASRHGQLEILQLLVSRGASLTTSPSPLVLACEHGHSDVVRWLLETCEAEADVKGNKSAALTEAVSQGHLEIVQHLVSVDEHGTLEETAVIAAARSGKLRVLKSLGANNFTAFADRGLLKQLVLDNAVNREDIGVLRYLLDLGVLNQTEMNKGLGVATQLQNLEIIRLFVGNGADIDAFTDKREEKTPLFYAIEHNRVDVVEVLLILRADANKPASGDQYSAIHTMASFGRLDMLQLVQRVCGSAANFKAPNKRERHTPLHLAASNGYVDVVHFLLEHLGPEVDIDVETRYDDTPLSLAAKNGHLEVVRLLVTEGAAINNQTNGGSTTALFCAAKYGQFDVVQFLCEQGANVLWRRYDGVSALCIASRNGSADIVEYLAEVCGADLNAVTFDLTALNEAVIHGRTDVVRVLLTHNANTRDDLERRSNLLCQAIVYNKADVAHLLVKNGADVNASYRLTVNDVELKVTPLIVAAGVGNLELVKFLCANGADVEDASNENETSLFFAAAFGRLDAVEYLVSERSANTQITSSYGFTPTDIVGSENVDIVACLVHHGAPPPTRRMLAKVAFNVLSNAESPLLQTGDLADDATYWRRKDGVGSLLSGDFLR